MKFTLEAHGADAKPLNQVVGAIWEREGSAATIPCDASHPLFALLCSEHNLMNQ